MHMRSLGVTITGNKRKMTLLLGPRGAGKTALFHQLRDGRFIETVTSMEELEGKFAVHGNFNTINFGAHLTVIDYPGHERLRSYVPTCVTITPRIAIGLRQPNEPPCVSAVAVWRTTTR
jgi:signal recognition particle receptor subunit beta